MAKARVRLIENLSRSPSRWIPRALASPHKEDIAREYLDYVDTNLDENPSRALPLCRVAIRLAAGVDRPTLARAFGALGHGHRALGEYTKAGRAIEIAFRVAAEDIATRVVLFRRRSYLKSAIGDVEGSFSDINVALRLDTGNSDGVGRSLLYRGAFELHRGRFAECENDARLALTLLCPKQSPRWRSWAFHLLSLTLAKSGTIESVRDTLAALPSIYKTLKGHRGISAERAKVKWLEGLLHARLGSNNRAHSLLRQARDTFVKLKMPEELAAVTADLALVLHPDRDAIRAVVRPVGQLEKTGEIRFPEALGKALGELWNSTQQDNPREDWLPELRLERQRSMLHAIGSLRGFFDQRESIPASLLPVPPPARSRTPEPRPIGF